MTGAALKAWRRTRHLSQMQAARRLGYSQGHWSYLETERLPIPPALQRALALSPGGDFPRPPGKTRFRQIYGTVGQFRNRLQGWRRIEVAPAEVQTAYEVWRQKKRQKRQRKVKNDQNL